MNKESIWSYLQSAGGGDFEAPFGLTEGEIYYFEITDSTNVRAWEETRQGTGDGALFVANDQSQGKGRRGRQWVNTPGCNLCFSLRLYPTLGPERISMVTLVMALAVAKAVESMTGLECGIKWPNDILVQGRKVCGILTELKMDGSHTECLIIGVGINVKEQEFPGELQARAGALEVLCGREIIREQLLAELLKAFEEDYRCFLERGDLTDLQEDYQHRLLNLNQPVRILEAAGTYEGVALGITPMGKLLVRTPDGNVECVYAGEVSVRGPEGYI
ncbi:MAG: biotin--[Lachnospiraceae bacterium]|nr:biotin--[acetyl-CoA-carboxylase] ligase [Lachnospiraceae bacterium]